MTRVALHVHSTWSYDGECELREIATLFRRVGFDVVLMAEHSRSFDTERWRAYQVACKDASDRIVLVPGLEYEDPGNDVHILVWGVRSFLGAKPETVDVLRAVRTEGGLAVLAHPARRRATTRLSEESVALLDGIEIWNRRYDGWVPLRPVPKLGDAKLMQTVGLDFHRRLDFFPLAMELDLPQRSPDADLLDAIRGGHYVCTVAGIAVSRFANGWGRRFATRLDRARRLGARLLRIHD